jgi:hypothetical protein
MCEGLMNAVGVNSRNVKVNMVNEWALYPLKKLIPGFNLSFMPSVNPKHQDVWLVQTQDDQTITDMLELIAPTMRECGTKYELLLLLQAMREPGNRNRGADVALIFRDTLGVGASKACGQIRAQSRVPSLLTPATDARLHSAPPCAKLACAHSLTPARLYSAKLRGWSRASSRPG